MTRTEPMRIGASTPRRVIGFGAMIGLGLLLVSLALTMQGVLMARVFLGLCGVMALWGARVMWWATAHELILIDDALMDSDGTVLARLDQIASVDRSPFAMKPSNGFVLKLKAPASRVWRPGLWWRFGRRVAIGGVTSGAVTRPMADVIAARLNDARQA